MLDPFFSPKTMAEREPELRKQAGELIDAIVAKGQCEVVAVWPHRSRRRFS